MKFAKNNLKAGLKTPSPKMLYCPQGHINPLGNRFCQVCGQEIPQPVTEKFPTGTSFAEKLVGDRYRIIKQLGQGGFGRTYLAEDINRFHELCVLKEFAPKLQGTSALKKAEELFTREAGVMYRLQHPQIPRFRELCRCQVGSQTSLFLVQDYVAGQTYRDLLIHRQRQGTRFSEAEIMELLRQILPVLDYIHSQGVIHRDISPDNLILRSSDQLPVLIDFGGVKQIAANIEQSGEQSGNEGNESNQASFGSTGQHGSTPKKTPQLMTRIGKLGYAPEEQMISGKVHPHSDLYSLAVTVLVLLTGKEPATLFDTHEMRWAWEPLVTLSPRLTQVLNKMLSRSPGDRFQSASSVLSALGFSLPTTTTPAVMGAKLSASLSANPSNLPTELPPELKGESGWQPSSSQLEPVPSTAVSLPGNLPDTHLIGAADSQIFSQAASTSLNPARKSFFAARFGGFWGQIILLLLVVCGASIAGWSVANYWLKSGSFQRATNEGKLLAPEPAKSDDLAAQTEAELKTELQERRATLGINLQFFMRLVDQMFYLQYPEKANQRLTMNPEDAIWRYRWHIVGLELLDDLELLSEPARRNLGRYKISDLGQWQRRLNQSGVNSEALIVLSDRQFFTWFPNLSDEDFINQPIGQVWYAIAFDQFTILQNQSE